MALTKMTIYRSELERLTERAKGRNPKSDGLYLGEKFFVTLLHHHIREYRTGRISREQLTRLKKELEEDLMLYWDSRAMFAQACEVRNRQSEWFIKAEKEGCPICKRLVGI